MQMEFGAMQRDIKSERIGRHEGGALQIQAKNEAPPPRNRAARKSPGVAPHRFALLGEALNGSKGARSLVLGAGVGGRVS
jgi:hypothetical protein